MAVPAPIIADIVVRFWTTDGMIVLADETRLVGHRSR
jgi:hypothetical protein